MRRAVLLWVAVAVLGALTVVFVVAKKAPSGTPVAGAEASCAALVVPVRQTVDLKTGATTFTPRPAGATDDRDPVPPLGVFDRGRPFAVAGAAAPGLVPVQLLETAAGDRLYTEVPDEISRAVAAGYVQRGPAFYGLGGPTTCGAPIQQMTRAGRHQYAASSNVESDLRAEGWHDDGTAFYAVTSRARAPRPETTPTKAPVAALHAGQFTIAVLPDTQQEVLDPADGRFADRTRWLARNRDALNLRFTAHVGDVVNWDTADHEQYVRARQAMDVLGQARIPYAVAPGNHDAQATCPGGAACPGRDIPSALRDTTVLNTYFPPSSFPAMRGSFERGKVDNSYQLFTAEGKRFLVLTLEMGPRPAVLRWARSVISSHPHHNVILLTHYYLTATGQIAESSDYGDAAPAAVYRELVRPFPNVKLVLSGHVGTGADRMDQPVRGRDVVSFLQCFHDGETNPTRLLRIDVRQGTVSSIVYSPATAVTYPRLRTAPVRVNWI